MQTSAAKIRNKLGVREILPPSDAEREHYKLKLDTVRLSPADIGRKVGVSATTVRDVLANNRTHFASTDTVRRIFLQIDCEAEALGEALNKLSKGAIG